MCLTAMTCPAPCTKHSLTNIVETTAVLIQEKQKNNEEVLHAIETGYHKNATKAPYTRNILQ